MKRSWKILVYIFFVGMHIPLGLSARVIGFDSCVRTWNSELKKYEAQKGKKMSKGEFIQALAKNNEIAIPIYITNALGLDLNKSEKDVLNNIDMNDNEIKSSIDKVKGYIELKKSGFGAFMEGAEEDHNIRLFLLKKYATVLINYALTNDITKEEMDTIYSSIRIKGSRLEPLLEKAKLIQSQESLEKQVELVLQKINNLTKEAQIQFRSA